MNFPASPACQLVPQATMRTFWKSRNCCSEICMSSRNTLPLSCDIRPRSVSRMARGCSKISFCIKCLAALFRHDRVPGNLVGGPLHRLAIEICNTNPISRQHSYIAIREKENVARVLQQCRNVAGHEVFAVSQANHGRRSDSGGHELLRVLSREKHQRINAP